MNMATWEDAVASVLGTLTALWRNMPTWLDLGAVLLSILTTLTTLWFFWDKIVPWFRRTRAVQSLPKWAPGRWRSDAGTNSLDIAKDLSWTWTSTYRGRWSGSGHGRVSDGYLVLEGSRSGANVHGQPFPSTQITFRLKREDDRLAGEIRTSITYDILFIRDQ